MTKALAERGDGDTGLKKGRGVATRFQKLITSAKSNTLIILCQTYHSICSEVVDSISKFTDCALRELSIHVLAVTCFAELFTRPL